MAGQAQSVQHVSHFAVSGGCQRIVQHRQSWKYGRHRQQRRDRLDGHHRTDRLHGGPNRHRDGQYDWVLLLLRVQDAGDVRRFGCCHRLGGAHLDGRGVGSHAQRSGGNADEGRLLCPELW